MEIPWSIPRVIPWSFYREFSRVKYSMEFHWVPRPPFHRIAIFRDILSIGMWQHHSINDILLRRRPPLPING